MLSSHLRLDVSGMYFRLKIYGQNFVDVSYFSHACYTFGPIVVSVFCHLTCIWWLLSYRNGEVQVSNLGP